MLQAPMPSPIPPFLIESNKSGSISKAIILIIHCSIYTFSSNTEICRFGYGIKILSSPYLSPPPTLSSLPQTPGTPSQLDPTLLPTHWSMLTVSDSNLCTLLSMTKKEEALTLMSQLPTFLGHALTQCSSLGEAVASNNSGLPTDAARKPRLLTTSHPSTSSTPSFGSKDPLVVVGVNDRANELGASSPAGISVIPVANLAGGGGVVGVASAAGQGGSSGQLKVLSQSPHIIMCCPNNGSVSYILTLPTPDPAPAPLGSGNGNRPPQSGGQGAPQNSSGGQLGGRGEGVVTRNRKIFKKGMAPQEEQVDVTECIQRAISRLLRTPNSHRPPATHVPPVDLNPPPPTPLPPSTTPPCHSATLPGAARSRDLKVGSHDYDPEKFSKFADFLVKMDPIESLSGLPDDDLVTSRPGRTGSVRSNESDWSGEGSLGHSSVGSLGHNCSLESCKSLGHGGQESLGHTAGHSFMDTSSSGCHNSVEGLGHAAGYESLGCTAGHDSSGQHSNMAGPGAGVSPAPTPLEEGEGHEEMQVLETSEDLTQLPDLPMSWLFPEPGGVVDPQADPSHSEDWRQFLHDPTGNSIDHTLSSQISSLVDKAVAPSGLEGVQLYGGVTSGSGDDAAKSGSLETPPGGSGVVGVDSSAAAADISSDWNGMWQDLDSNPDPISSWFQSDLSLGEFHNI